MTADAHHPFGRVPAVRTDALQAKVAPPFSHSMAASLVASCANNRNPAHIPQEAAGRPRRSAVIPARPRLRTPALAAHPRPARSDPDRPVTPEVNDLLASDGRRRGMESSWPPSVSSLACQIRVRSRRRTPTNLPRCRGEDGLFSGVRPSPTNSDHRSTEFESWGSPTACQAVFRPIRNARSDEADPWCVPGWTRSGDLLGQYQRPGATTRSGDSSVAARVAVARARAAKALSRSSNEPGARSPPTAPARGWSHALPAGSAPPQPPSTGAAGAAVARNGQRAPSQSGRPPASDATSGARSPARR